MTTTTKESSTTTGIGFTGFLTLIFVTLKLTGVIAWSWWWVLSPLWIGALTGVVYMACVGLFVLFVALIWGGD